MKEWGHSVPRRKTKASQLTGAHRSRELNFLLAKTVARQYIRRDMAPALASLHITASSGELREE
jgi:hypothetical protein